MTDRSLYWVDASSNNEPINLTAYAAAGHKHIALKATEGITYEWTNGHAIHDQAHFLELTVDRYHWVRPDSGTAKQQAAFFVGKVVGHMKPGDGWFPDWETSTNYATGQPVPDPPDAEWAQFMADFIAESDRLFKARLSFPLAKRLYTADWYLDGKPHMQTEARKHELVLAEYNGVTQPTNRFGMPNVSAHQFTDNATVAGFPRPVDYNVWLKVPKPAEEGFVMDKDAKSRFDQLEKDIADLREHVDNLFSHGHDGDPDQLAAIVRQELRAVGLHAKDGQK